MVEITMAGKHRPVHAIDKTKKDSGIPSQEYMHERCPFISDILVAEELQEFASVSTSISIDMCSFSSGSCLLHYILSLGSNREVFLKIQVQVM